jgi:hypothetical protein
MASEKLRRFGAATVEVMRRVIAPMIGRDELADAIGYITNAGVPSAVVPDFIGQVLFDTDNNAWYKAFGVAAGEFTLMGAGAVSGAELAVLNGASSTPTADKAVIADATGAVSLSGNTAIAQGAGLSAATAFKTSVVNEGGIFVTRILIDLEGLNGGGTAGDIIGNDGAGVAFLTQITAAKNGSIIAGTVACMETPAGSNVDVDLWSADEATGVEDTAISALTNEVQLINHGNWAVSEVAAISSLPVADQYLYLTSGAATAGAFTAGKFLITLYGV